VYEWLDPVAAIDDVRGLRAELASVKAQLREATYEPRRQKIESARALRFLRDVKGHKLSPRQEEIIAMWADGEP
jgi:hypothetical protein